MLLNGGILGGAGYFSEVRRGCYETDIVRVEPEKLVPSVAVRMPVGTVFQDQSTGDKCLKLFYEPWDWKSAAQRCDGDGAAGVCVQRTGCCQHSGTQADKSAREIITKERGPYEQYVGLPLVF